METTVAITPVSAISILIYEPGTLTAKTIRHIMGGHRLFSAQDTELAIQK